MLQRRSGDQEICVPFGFPSSVCGNPKVRGVIEDVVGDGKNKGMMAKGRKLLKLANRRGDVLTCL